MKTLVRNTAVIVALGALIVSALPVVAMAASSTAPSYSLITTQSYGDIKRVPVSDNSNVGWVAYVLDGNTHKYIVNLNGAPYGARKTILTNQAVPYGWAFTTYDGKTQNILNLNGAPIGSIDSVLDSSPIPSGWVVIARNNGIKSIKKVS
ncbi:hypothetical protein GK047_28225 [Paenibacillus sp. SYP-B3998]|uniref:Uncharacterized protein n=1 Tax=Paenibacillus sp. SYP-B3998 TaxID=2678564 RepID=A0A6G4A7L4_9BACL|nr:hypothetical protein [Paenibacillus sp. SYP-B3998]NEW09811.1 hypothetical protein [Paenibacillus sp. SYP-B3998]